MDLNSEFNLIKEQINAALDDSLKDIAEDLLDAMHEEAAKTVYGYAATPEAMATRRGTIADIENFRVDYGELSATITSIAEMQGTDYGVTEGDFVQLGLHNYKQPYERDFMYESLKKYVQDGKVDEAIKRALERNGIDTSTYVGGGHDISENLVATRRLGG